MPWEAVTQRWSLLLPTMKCKPTTLMLTKIVQLRLNMDMLHGDDDEPDVDDGDADDADDDQSEEI